MVANLETAAQAQALNDIMSNYQAQLKKRYNDAYRKAQQRAKTPTVNKPKGDVKLEDSAKDTQPATATTLQYPVAGSVNTSIWNPFTNQYETYVDDTLTYVNGEPYKKSTGNGLGSANGLEQTVNYIGSAARNVASLAFPFLRTY